MLVHYDLLKQLIESQKNEGRMDSEGSSCASPCLKKGSNKLILHQIKFV